MKSKWKAGQLGAVMLAATLVSAPAALATHSMQVPPESEPSDTLEVLGRFVVPFDNLTSDVWAHGNYAYLGSFNQPFCSFDLTGVRVIDISDPANPVQVAFIKDKMGTRTNDVKVAHIETPHFSGEILVTVNEGCGVTLPRLNANGNAAKPRGGQGGISIWNVTDPTKPRAMKQNFLPKGNGIHNTFIWQQDSNAYLIAVDDVDARDVIIVDITKPQSPKEITRVGAPDWPNLDFSEIEGPAVFLHDVWVQENDGRVIAYLSYWDAGLVLLDVTDPANPVFLGDSLYPNPDKSGLPPEGNGHVAVPTADGSLVIFGDEDTAKFSTFGTFDIGGIPSTNKVGSALFGPQPAVDTFPEPSDVVAVAADFGCNAGDFVATPGDVVLIERGVCFFSTKAANAQAAGYDAYIVFNDAARGDGIINMSAGTADVITIPGIFVGNTVGSAMAAEIGGGGAVTVVGVDGLEDGEGFMRVMDVTEPGNIVQVGSFVTEGVLPPANAQLAGTRDAHNVVLNDGRPGLAYWAWYYEGIRVVDFSACTADVGFEGCTPDISEVAHYGGGTTPPANFWGVYVHDHPDGNTYILGSDRGDGSADSGGLWIFRHP
jgi:hypothetical protein